MSRPSSSTSGSSISYPVPGPSSARLQPAPPTTMVAPRPPIPVLTAMNAWINFRSEQAAIEKERKEAERILKIEEAEEDKARRLEDAAARGDEAAYAKIEKEVIEIPEVKMHQTSLSTEMSQVWNQMGPEAQAPYHKLAKHQQRVQEAQVEQLRDLQRRGLPLYPEELQALQKFDSKKKKRKRKGRGVKGDEEEEMAPRRPAKRRRTAGRASSASTRVSMPSTSASASSLAPYPVLHAPAAQRGLLGQPAGLWAPAPQPQNQGPYHQGMVQQGTAVFRQQSWYRQPGVPPHVDPLSVAMFGLPGPSDGNLPLMAPQPRRPSRTQPQPQATLPYSQPQGESENIPLGGMFARGEMEQFLQAPLPQPRRPSRTQPQPQATLPYSQPQGESENIPLGGMLALEEMEQFLQAPLPKLDDPFVQPQEQVGPQANWWMEDPLVGLDMLTHGGGVQSGLAEPVPAPSLDMAGFEELWEMPAGPSHTQGVDFDPLLAAIDGLQGGDGGMPTGDPLYDPAGGDYQQDVDYSAFPYIA